MRPFLRQSEQFTWRVSALESSGTSVPGESQGLNPLPWKIAAGEDCSGSGRASKNEHDGRTTECDTCGKTVRVNQYAAMHKHRPPNPQQRQANSEPVWYHASPHDFAEGDELTPGGGDSPFASASYAYQPDFAQRGEDHVWISPTLNDAHEWRNAMGEDYEGEDYQPAHIYEVRPHSTPEDHGEDEGWASDGATIVRKIFDGHTGDVLRQANSRLAAVTQDMVDNLNTQFHDWWGQQNNSGGSVDDFAMNDFMDEDRGPIGHWPNIENFLKEKYPAAHKGLGMGLEAEWSLDGHAKPYLTGPEAIKQHGYDPSEIAAGMLLLHNQSDPFRGDMAQQDQDRLNDIAQKRFKMQRDYDNRQSQPAAKELVTAYRTAMAWQDWADKIEHDLHPGLNYGMYSINHDNPQDLTTGMSTLHYMRRPDEGIVEVEGISTDRRFRNDGVAEALMRRLHEDNPDLKIDPGYMTSDGKAFHNRMLEKEPAAKELVIARRFWAVGDSPEERQANWRVAASPCPDCERAAAEGYDYCEDCADKEEKRHYQELRDLERDYQERQANSRLAAFNQELLDRLHGEYMDWYDQNGNEKLNWAGRGPLGNWRQIENFLKSNYPAAHRGLNAGQESVMPLLDFNSLILSPLNGEKDTKAPYETGPDAFKQYGYDPKEVAAGMLLLHNQSHPQRGDMLDYDLGRLNDIAQKRFQMQRDYEQRRANWRKTAADLVKEYTDGLYDEFHDWAREQEYVPVGFSKNDPAVMNPDYTKPMGGPLSYWDNIEGFFKDRYPAVFRDYRYGEENAADALDGHALRMPARYSPWPTRSVHPPYETGPEAEAKYGYDPRQVAAGFMYLHSTAHNTARPTDRADRIPRDIDRLAEIFQKRQQMQRDYEQRQPQSITAALDLLRMSNRIERLASPWTFNNKVTVPVGSKYGLHMTPSVLISNAVKKTGWPVWLIDESGNRVDAKDPMAIMSLGARNGSPITVHCDHPDIVSQIAEYVSRDHD